MKKIAFFNAKGGTGKTTICFNYGHYLAELNNKKVLFMDFDPQVNLAYSFGKGYKTSSGNNLDRLIVNFLKDKKIDLEEYLIKINKNISLLPSTNNISLVDEYLTDYIVRESIANNTPYSAYQRNIIIKRILEKVIKPWEYDYLLVDCQPSFSLLSTTAMIYCENVLVVLKPEPYSFADIDYLKKIIRSLNKRFDTDIKIIGAIINAFESSKNMSREISKKIYENYGKDFIVFKEKVKFLSNFQNSIAESNEPVFKAYPGSEASKSILKLFLEIDDISFSMIH